MAPRVHFITGNANKLSEVKAILEPEIEVQSLSIDLEEVQGSVEEVTLSKCQRAADIVSSRGYAHQSPRALILMERSLLQVDGPVLVEDTALCFNALGGLPGVYMYAKPFILHLLDRASLTMPFQQVVPNNYWSRWPEQPSSCLLRQVC